MTFRWHAAINGQAVDAHASVNFLIRSGRESLDDQPEASSATVTFVADDDRMEWLKADADLTLWAETPEGWADPANPSLIAWTGKTGDIVRTRAIRTDRATGRQIVKHTASTISAGILARLARRNIGDEPWPVELDGVRVARALKLGRVEPGPIADIQLAADPDLARVDDESAWTTDGTAPGTTVTIEPGMITFDCSALPKRRTWAATPGTWRDQRGSWRGQSPHNVVTSRMPVSVAAAIEMISRVTVESESDVTLSLAIGATPPTAEFGNPAARIAETTITARAGEALVAGSWHPLKFAERYARVRVVTRSSGTVRFIGVHGFPIEPGTVELIRRDYDRTPVSQVAQTCATSGRGVLWETRRGSLAYHDGHHRGRGCAPAVIIDARCISEDGSSQRESASARINRLTIAYGDAGEGEQPEIVIENASSIAEVDEYDARLVTDLAHIDDAYQIGHRIVTNRSRVLPSFESLPVLIDSMPPLEAARLLATPAGSLIAIVGLPAGAYESQTWRGYIEGSTITHDAPTPARNGRTVMTLNVTDARESINLLTWRELDPGATWRDGLGTWKQATGDTPVTREEARV